MIITNSSPDDFYFEQLLAFLMSMRINSPTHSIHVFLANYHNDIENKLKSSFSEYTFENRKLEMIDKRGFSFILFRIAMIKECFEKYKESVAWIDTDVLIRKDINSFLEIRPNQLKILTRKSDGIGAPINAGIFNLGYSKASYKLVCDWQDECVENPEWGQGQKKLWKTYKKHSDVIELVKMSEKFNDLGGRNKPNAFSDDSVMWHCKKNHFKNEKYQKEYQMYLKEGKKLFNG